MPETALSTGTAGEGSGASEQGATEQVQDKAKEVAGQAQEKAREAGEQARGRVRDQVDQRSTQAGEQLRGSAGDVRSFADQLREQGKDKPAQYVEQAADRAERLGGYLEQSDGERILHDVEDFGRRNPWAVVAGGIALGFAASRLLKASSSERYRSLPQRSGATGPGNGLTPSHGSSIEPRGATSSPPSQFEPHS
jgi:ElaB/YqjD/DUF883 family membrane-anchored ribosome-binding protein